MDTAALSTRSGDDLGLLYARAAPSLRRLIGDWMRLPDAVLDDACQVAWLRYMSHRRRVARPAVLSWLLRTAAHEACRSLSRHDNEVSLEALQAAEDEPDGDWERWLGRDPTDDLDDHVFRVQALGALAPRQRRMMWLQGSGLSYEEIARATGDSPRTVERQLVRARRELEAAGVRPRRGARSPSTTEPALSAAPVRACAAAAPPG